jgi:hypothetical protein
MAIVIAAFGACGEKALKYALRNPAKRVCVPFMKADIKLLGRRVIANCRNCT